ncbi:MAG: hypothetical protein JSU08_13170 [Acidobacteria bacterium]|nr:hypothetical protein [Acidobacteriota bacterium]
MCRRRRRTEPEHLEHAGHEQPGDDHAVGQPQWDVGFEFEHVDPARVAVRDLVDSLVGAVRPDYRSSLGLVAGEQQFGNRERVRRERSAQPYQQLDRHHDPRQRHHERRDRGRSACAVGLTVGDLRHAAERERVGLDRRERRGRHVRHVVVDLRRRGHQRHCHAVPTRAKHRREHDAASERSLDRLDVRIVNLRIDVLRIRQQHDLAGNGLVARVQQRVLEHVGYRVDQQRVRVERVLVG